MIIQPPTKTIIGGAATTATKRYIASCNVSNKYNASSSSASLLLIGALLIFTTAMMSGISPAADAAPVSTPESPVYTLFADKSLSWHVLSDTVTGQDDIVVTMNVKDGSWFGMGFCDEGMDGSMVLCAYNEDPVNFNASCHMYTGKRYGAYRDVARESLLTYSAATRSADGVVTITYQVRRSEINADHDGKEQRVIFGNGGFDYVTKVAGPHGGPFPQHIKRNRINVLDGTLRPETRPMTHRNIAWIVTGCVIALWCVAGVVYTYLLVVTPTLWMLYAIQALFIVSFLGLFGLMIGMSYLDYKDGFQNSAVIRAFGDGAAFIFTFILLFATNTLSIGKLVFRSSLARTIPFHVMLGLFLFCVVTVHFLGMMVNYAAANNFGFNFMFRVNTPNKNLLAVMGFAVLLLLTIIAALRQKVYTIFRYSHFLLTPTAIVLFILHHPPMFWQMLPSIVIYLCDVIARIVSAIRNGGDVVEMSATIVGGGGGDKKDTPEGILTVKIRTSWRDVDAGQYAFFSVHSAGGMHRLMHPFSIAEFTPDDNNKKDGGGGIATFYIKSMGNSTLTGTWFAHALKQQQQNGSGSIDDTSASSHPKAMVMGPYGSLMVPLESCGHVVLAAGGIGITPMLSTLQYIANQVNTPPEKKKKDGGDEVDLKLLPRLKSVTLVWSVRDQEVYDLIAPRLEFHANRIRSAADSDVIVDLQLYVTRSAKKGATATQKAGVLEVPNPVDVPPTTTTDNTTTTATEMTEIHHQEDVDGQPPSTPTNDAAVNEANADGDDISPQSASTLPPPQPAKTGRPNMNEILGNVASKTTPASACNIGRLTDADNKQNNNNNSEEEQQQHPVGLYSCGPPAFISSASDIGSKLGMLVHSEVFEF